MQTDSLNLDSYSNNAHLRDKQIAGPVLPVSRATLWRWSKDGKFPRPVKLGPGVTAWKVGDVRLWLEQQAAKGAA